VSDTPPGPVAPAGAPAPTDPPRADPARRRRPAELTVVVVLTYLVGFADVVLGALLILARYLPELESDAAPRLVVTVAGAATILLGFLEIALASGIARADRAARIILTVLLALGVLLDVLVLGAADDLWYQAADIVIAAAVIAVLWTGRVARFFGPRGG